MTTPDGYLTMARIMAKEMKKYEHSNIWGKGHTGFQEILVRDAFKAGFMAGFAGRYFNDEEQR